MTQVTLLFMRLVISNHKKQFHTFINAPASEANIIMIGYQSGSGLTLPSIQTAWYLT